MADLYGDQWIDVTDSFVCDIQARPGTGYWPSMVTVDHYDDGYSITPDDARRLAAMLVKAADSADAHDERRFEQSRRASVGSPGGPERG